VPCEITPEPLIAFTERHAIGDSPRQDNIKMDVKDLNWTNLVQVSVLICHFG